MFEDSDIQLKTARGLSQAPDITTLASPNEWYLMIISNFMNSVKSAKAEAPLQLEHQHPQHSKAHHTEQHNTAIARKKNR